MATPQAAATATKRVGSGRARRASFRGRLPMTLGSYLGLLDRTGRQLRAGTRGVIPPALASILDRLQTAAESWLARDGRPVRPPVPPRGGPGRPSAPAKGNILIRRCRIGSPDVSVIACSVCRSSGNVILDVRFVTRPSVITNLDYSGGLWEIVKAVLAMTLDVKNSDVRYADALLGGCLPDRSATWPSRGLGPSRFHPSGSGLSMPVGTAGRG